MLPLRHALVLAAAILLVSGWLCLHRAGYHADHFLEKLSASLEKYGLYGYAAASRIAAAERHLRAIRSGTGSPQRRIEADAAATDLAEAARLLASQGAHHQATRLLQRAAELAPWRTELVAQVLEVQIRQGDRLALSRAYDLAFRREDPEGLALMGALYLRHGLTDDGLGCLRRAAEKAPDRYAIQLALAQYLHRTGAREQAQPHARAAFQVAQTLGQRLEAAELLRSMDPRTPSPWALYREHLYHEYLPTLLVLVAYVAALSSPWLVSRARRAGRRLRRRCAPLQVVD